MIKANEIESLGFIKKESIGWAKFRKNNFELVEIPTSNGLLIGFEYQYDSQSKYKILNMNQLKQIYFIITGKDLYND